MLWLWPLDSVAAYNFGRRLKALAPYEFICKQ